MYRRIPDQWPRIDLQQDHRRKVTESKERDTHRDARSTQNTKQMRSEMSHKL